MQQWILGNTVRQSPPAINIIFKSLVNISSLERSHKEDKTVGWNIWLQNKRDRRKRSDFFHTINIFLVLLSRV